MRIFCAKYLIGLLVATQLLLAPVSLQAQQSGFYYQVQPSDTVERVAARYGMAASQIRSANKLPSGSKLKPGTRLWIPKAPARVASKTPAKPTTSSSKTSTTKSTSTSKTTTKPTVSKPVPITAPTTRTSSASSSNGTHVVRSGDTLHGISTRYGMTVEELSRLNGISTRQPIHVGQRLVISSGSGPEDVPGGGVVERSETAPASSSSSVRPSRQGFIWPTEGRLLRRYTDRADEKYTGIDIATPKGTEIRAARDGEVVYASDTIPSFGKMIIINHGGELATCYGHLDRYLVQKGQKVRQGQVIGRSGDTGRGNEPFLHFEVRRNGEAVNPESFLP